MLSRLRRLILGAARMPGNELTCTELVELVTDYLKGTLPPSERARLEAHLDGCEACSAYLDQMRQTIALTGRLSEGSIPLEAREELLVRFRDWRRAGG